MIKFGNIETEKQKFHTKPNDVNINRIVVSNMVPFGKKGFKYFSGYESGDEKAMPLCIMLPKTSACRRDFDETKYMSFLIKDSELLEKYNDIWDKVSKVIKKRI